MIVVDSNIVVYFLVAGQRTPVARALFECDPDWLMPELLPHELLNILANLFRQGYLNEHQCQSAWQKGCEMVEGCLAQLDMEAALGLALKHQISGYDAQYVELARSRKLPLVTEDGEILMKFPKIALNMTDFMANKN